MSLPSSADSSPPKTPEAITKKGKLNAIDAIRGWAIFLVITAHVGGLFPELPWPLKKITNFGWYGVQLFFVASAFTLMLSWERMQQGFIVKTANFFLRRLFRIVPVFYLGALWYLFARPPGELFDWSQLWATLCFVNAWQPAWLTTLDSKWQVIPGSWSVSVEFAFYAAFPFLASVASTLSRSLTLFVGGVALMFVSPYLGYTLIGTHLSAREADNFLFFWPPNQLAIFLSGIVLFHLLVSKASIAVAVRNHAERFPGRVMLAAAFILLVLTQAAARKTSETVGIFYPAPTHFIVAALFVALCACLISAPGRFPLVTGVAWQRLGEGSFAAYVIHWSLLDLCHYLYSSAAIRPSGWEAIGHFVMALVAVTGATFLFSTIIHRTIERPAIRLGRRLEFSG